MPTNRSPSPVPGSAPWLNPDLPLQVPCKPKPAKRAKQDVKPRGGSRARRVRPARAPTKAQRPARKADPAVAGEGAHKHNDKKSTPTTASNVPGDDEAGTAPKTVSTSTVKTSCTAPLERHFVARPGRAPLHVPSRFEPPQEPIHAHLFLGRTCCPPFVFYTSAPLSAPASNARWARDGEIAENEYHIEVGAGRVLAAGRVGELAQAVCNVNDKKRKACDVGHDTTSYPTPTPQPTDSTSFAPATFRTSCGWTAAQNRAMWETQLMCGEGKNWPAVRAAVNATGRAKTQDECRHKWARERAKVFGR